MTTHCRYCGEAVRPNTMFCASCGQIIVADEQRPQSAPPFPTTGGGRRSEVAPGPVASPTELPPVPLPSVPTWGRPPVTQAPTPVTSAPTQVVPAAPAPTQAVPAAPQTSQAASSPLTLVLPGGARVSVDRTIVLGRQPTAGAAQHGGIPVEVADPSRSMSRVHLVVAPTRGGGGIATDPGSGNGTVVIRSGARHPLVTGEPFVLAQADRLVLGDVVVDVDVA